MAFAKQFKQIVNSVKAEKKKEKNDLSQVPDIKFNYLLYTMTFDKIGKFTTTHSLN